MADGETVINMIFLHPGRKPSSVPRSCTGRTPASPSSRCSPRLPSPLLPAQPMPPSPPPPLSWSNLNQWKQISLGAEAAGWMIWMKTCHLKLPNFIWSCLSVKFGLNARSLAKWVLEDICICCAWLLLGDWERGCMLHNFDGGKYKCQYMQKSWKNLTFSILLLRSNTSKVRTNYK